ncbi:MAG: hypothetical protein ACP5MH_11640 [Thermoproteus sp.]
MRASGYAYAQDKDRSSIEQTGLSWIKGNFIDFREYIDGWTYSWFFDDYERIKGERYDEHIWWKNLGADTLAAFSSTRLKNAKARTRSSSSIST